MRIQTVATLALASLVLVACGPGKFSKEAAIANAEAGVLRYPIPNNPSSLDPAVVQDGDTLDMLQQIYEGLVGWDENNDVVGLLAESWEISPDGTEYTFKVRKGVKFHDGSDLTAEDIKRSIERACNPGLRSVTVDAYLSDVVGLLEMKEGKASEVAGITVPDSHTVVFKLKQPTPYFLGKLTYLVSAPVSKSAAPADKEMNDIKQAVGTGPYKLTRYEPKQLAVMEANADYWGGAPKLKRIERTVALDATTKLQQFKAGQYDLVQLQRQDVSALQKDPEYKDQIKFFDRPAIWYVGLNQNSYAPFKDKRVRQAVAMAIDRDKIVNQLLGGVNTPAKTIVPPGVKGHRETGNGLPFDPAAAKKLLAEAGYPDGKGLPELKMSFRVGYPDIRLVAEAVSEQLGTNLGMKITASPIEWRKYLDDYNKKNVHQIYHMRWAADYLDPQNFLSHMLATNGPENKMGYSNPQFDELCKRADSLLSFEDRLPLYQQAEDIALQDAVWVPLYFQRDAELHSPRIKNMRESLFGHLPQTKTEVQ